jgi:hypothetical protein
MKNNSLHFLITTLLAGNAFAATDSSIYLELGRDNDDGDSQYVDVTLGLDSGSQVFFGYGTSTSGLDNTDSTSFYVGIGSNPNADFGTAVTFSSQEKEFDFELIAVKLDLYFNNDDWAFTLSPELRDIDFYGDGSTLSPGLGAQIGYYGLDPFYISVGRTVYRYEDDPQSITMQTIGMGRFTRTISSTSGDSLGLDDYRNLLNLGFNYSKGKAGFKHVTSGSSTDNTTYTSNSLYVKYKFDINWDAQVTAGKADDDVEKTSFSSLSVGYHW